MLVELLYSSAATADMTGDMIVSLLETSRRNNARTGITGLLVYHERSFMQLLEGDEEAVMRLYQTIVDDPRHANSRILWKGPIVARAFSNWTMAFQALGDLEPQQLEGYSTFLEEGFDGEFTGENVSLAQSLMHSMRDAL